MNERISCFVMCMSQGWRAVRSLWAKMSYYYAESPHDSVETLHIRFSYHKEKQMVITLLNAHNKLWEDEELEK